MTGNSRKTSQQYRYHQKHLDFALHRGARDRSKKRGIEFNIKRSDIIIPEFCPILGIKLKRNIGKMGDDSPSLDRIDHTKGYISGNIRVISWRANRLKCDASVEEMRLVLSDLEKLNEST